MENFTDEREDYSFSVDFEILQNCFWDHVLWWNTNTRVQRYGTYENKRFENENRGSTDVNLVKFKFKSDYWRKSDASCNASDHND